MINLTPAGGNYNSSYSLPGSPGAADTQPRTPAAAAAKSGASTDDMNTQGRDKAGAPGQKTGTSPSSPFVDDNAPQEECRTCKNRKYQDGSNEMVSFKSAAHIAPEAAGAAVRAHEQEHVSNAYAKAEQNNGKVIRASVTIRMAVCPECGRSYVSGGTTNTQIKYYNEDNPYQKDLKTADSLRYGGMNADYAV